MAEASLKITPKPENEGGCALPEAGKPVTITGRAFVSSVSMNADVKNGTEKSVSIQLTDLAVQPEQQGKPAEEVLWGNPSS